ncbi:hypothetical protein FKM82_002815 [Ascaphus truei]
MATKQLAKQLGLIRKSSKMSLNSKNLCGPKSKQFFDYLIIIDFESTCWKDTKHYGQEIIEFPAVLLNTLNGEIESEFHNYVQPQEHPILSDFCTELTGITQCQVDEGIPLKICLSQFYTWIRKIQKEKNIDFLSAVPIHSTSENKMCGFVTWSDWDLGVCLLYECKRKQLRKPEILNSWIDLRITYKLFYDRKPKGLNGALQDLGIEFSGREHSGLDDSRNTANLAWRMICDGCVIKMTKSLDKVRPKITCAQPRNAFPVRDCNAGQSDGVQASTKNMAIIDKLTLEENLTSIYTDISSIPNARESYSTHVRSGQAVAAKTSNEIKIQELPTKTLINGLSTTLGNYQKYRSTYRSSLTTLQNGVKIGAFTSTPTDNCCLGTGHVLMSTTVSSVNDISALDISPSSDCLSMLADWEDAAVIEDSQEEPIVKSIQLEEPTLLTVDSPDTVSLPKNAIQNCTGFLNVKSLGFQPPTSHSNSVAYKSPDTIIYNVQRKVSNCSTFKLPSALGNKSTNRLSTFVERAEKSTSLPSCPKRKLSSVSFYSPPKKQPFAIHEDEVSAGNRSLPLTTSSRVAPSAVLNSMVHMNSTVRVVKTRKITAPLCNCGRRAKRLTVSNIGPNQGKAFYSCSVRKRNEENGKGCEYFKWEHTLVKEKSTHSSALLSTSGLSFTASGTSFNSSGPSDSHKTYVGLRPSMRT